MSEIPFFRFRVLTCFHPEFKVFAAYCLESGNVVTADDDETARNMMCELLEDEIAFAIKRGNLKNLTSSPASIMVWREWMRLAKSAYIKKVRLTFERELSIEGIDAEISFAFAMNHNAPPAAPAKEGEDERTDGSSASTAQRNNNARLAG